MERKVAITRSAQVVAGLVIFTAITTLIFQHYERIPFRICHPRPTLATSPKLFTQVPIFEHLSHDNDAAWAAAVMPEKLGFIYVRHNSTLRLEMGISMFHAMHCLSLLRQMIQARPGDEDAFVHVHHQIEGESQQHLHGEHIPHCLSYLAQSIQCSGDSTIEPPWLKTDSAGNIIGHGVDGHGIHHQCKDTKRLWEISKQSEDVPIDAWLWQPGDTVESVFGE